jgi:hypothetical protein
VTTDRLGREVRRTLRHPVFGEMQYVGRRGETDGYWEIEYTPAGFAHPVSVSIPSAGEPPTAADVSRVHEVLADLDGLFARARGAIADEYTQWTKTPLPRDWRTVLRFEDVALPPADAPDAEWEVTYWCEPAQHWLIVQLRGGRVTGAHMDG